ncbi:hypothetical protein EAE99_003995 [Botrytis elliptica]|nr:hypothetical protein EAE99_003995 [Botrytis elliptica]
MNRASDMVIKHIRPDIQCRYFGPTDARYGGSGCTHPLIFDIPSTVTHDLIPFDAPCFVLTVLTQISPNRELDFG